MSLDALLHFVSSAPDAPGEHVSSPEFAFVEVDEHGTVVGINPHARLTWNWRVGSELPADLLMALQDLDADVPAELPITRAGLRLRGMAKDDATGWFLVGHSQQTHGGSSTDVSSQAMMSQLPGPAVCLGPSGLATYVNEGAARAMAEQASDRLGRPILAELLHREDCWKLAELMEVAAGEGAAQATVRYGREERDAVIHLVSTENGTLQALIVDTVSREDAPGRLDVTRHALRELATSCADPRIFRDGALDILMDSLKLNAAVLYGVTPSQTDMACMGSRSLRATDTPSERIPLSGADAWRSRGASGNPASIDGPTWTAPVHDNGQFAGLLILSWNASSAMPDAHALDEVCGLFESLYSWIQLAVRYRTSVDAIDDALFGFSFRDDEHRRYHFATHQMERLTGRSSAYVMSNMSDWMEDVIHAEDAPLVRAHNKNLLGGNESRVTYRVLHTDGSVRWLREHATPRVDATGHVSVNGMLADVTEQKAAELVLLQAKREAESSARAKTSFIATMSHEIRTPLGAVNGYAQLLQREIEEFEEELGDDLPDQIHEFTTAINDRSQKLLSLVHDLFELSQLEMGHTTVQKTTVNVAPIVQRVADRLLPLLEEKGVDLELQMDASRYDVTGDARRIEQVLENLASNASKFTERGHVLIRVETHPDSIDISLSDTGIGISEAYVDELFDAFSQEEDYRNRRFEGTGLGLALVKRLLDLMDGSITVDSRKGGGSTFTVHLPSVTQDRAPATHAAHGFPRRTAHSA